MYPAFGKCAPGVQDWRASQQIRREIYEMLPQLGQFGMVKNYKVPSGTCGLIPEEDNRRGRGNLWTGHPTKMIAFIRD
jgi:hypothetical protein